MGRLELCNLLIQYRNDEIIDVYIRNRGDCKVDRNLHQFVRHYHQGLTRSEGFYCINTINTFASNELFAKLCQIF